MPTKTREIEQPEVPVSVGQLIIGTRLPCDFFIKEANTLRIFFKKYVLYTKISQDILRDKGIHEVYIYLNDVPNLDLYLSSNRWLKQTGDEDNKAEFKKYAYNKERYHQIDASLIQRGRKINFSLSVLDNFTFSPLIEASNEAPAEVDNSVLELDGDVVINIADLPRYREYVADLRNLAELPESDRMRIKSLAIRETSKIVLQDFFADPRSGEKIKEMRALVNDMIDCILEDNDAIYMLLSMKGHDYYTYTHSVNVAALSVSLGIAIELKRDDTEKLGIGALLHDIGKSTISHEILNKPGKLDDIEYNIMKTHVLEGEKIMRIHTTFPEESFRPLLEHHESLSGRGYPYGLSGKEISLFGRIAAISDCYDALTTRRPYRAAHSPFSALLMISKETRDYDSDLLKSFIKMLGKIK